MKPIHWILIALGVLAVLFGVGQCGDGTRMDKTLSEPTYTFKCAACKQASDITPTQIKKLKSEGRAEAVPGTMLKIECPHCAAIEASLHEPYTPERLGP